jgi:hypothetical protein
MKLLILFSFFAFLNLKVKAQVIPEFIGVKVDSLLSLKIDDNSKVQLANNWYFINTNNQDTIRLVEKIGRRKKVYYLAFSDSNFLQNGYCQEYFRDTLFRYCDITGGQYHGYEVFFNTNGKPYCQYKLNLGIRDGAYYLKDKETLKLQLTGQYIKGYKSGTEISYYDNGKVRKISVFELKYNSEQIIDTFNVSDSVTSFSVREYISAPSGIWVTYSETGEIKEIISYMKEEF